MELNFVLKIELRFRNRASMSTSSSDFTMELRFRNIPSISRSMFDFRAKPRFRNKSWNQSSILNSKLDLETEARFWSQISIFNSKLDFDIRSSIVLEKYLLLKTVKIKIFFFFIHKRNGTLLLPRMKDFRINPEFRICYVGHFILLILVFENYLK